MSPTSSRAEVAIGIAFGATLLSFVFAVVASQTWMAITLWSQLFVCGACIEILKVIKEK